MTVPWFVWLLGAAGVAVLFVAGVALHVLDAIREAERWAPFDEGGWE